MKRLLYNAIVVNYLDWTADLKKKVPLIDQRSHQIFFHNACASSYDCLLYAGKELVHIKKYIVVYEGCLRKKHSEYVLTALTI